MTEKCIKQFLTVSSGMRGSFAVLMGTFVDDKGRQYTEPILTSAFSGTSEEARRDANEWAEAEGLEVY